MKKKEYERARAAIQETAQKEGVSEEQVRREIQEAICQGMENARQSQDQAALKKWAMIKCEGEIPTPEEFVVWTGKVLKATQRIQKWFGWLDKK